ncbi:hypothetical protein [Candidatus Cytomitobacter indipagum]|nr:hypothetical protein [Candidatus Cytomitobacter indipagum]
MICIADIRSRKELFDKCASEIKSYNMANLEKLRTKEGYQECLEIAGREEALKRYYAYQIRKIENNPSPYGYNKSDLDTIYNDIKKHDEKFGLSSGIDAFYIFYVILEDAFDFRKHMTLIKANTECGDYNISLHELQLEYIPGAILNCLKNLESISLYIGGNKLTELPKEICNLSLRSFNYIGHGGNDENLIANSDPAVKEWFDRGCKAL